MHITFESRAMTNYTETAVQKQLINMLIDKYKLGPT
jgi:hypothetical protein